MDQISASNSFSRLRQAAGFSRRIVSLLNFQLKVPLLKLSDRIESAGCVYRQLNGELVDLDIFAGRIRARQGLLGEEILLTVDPKADIYAGYGWIRMEQLIPGSQLSILYREVAGSQRLIADSITVLNQPAVEATQSARTMNGSSSTN